MTFEALSKVDGTQMGKGEEKKDGRVNLRAYSKLVFSSDNMDAVHFFFKSLILGFHYYQLTWLFCVHEGRMDGKK